MDFCNFFCYTKFAINPFTEQKVEKENNPIGGLNIKS